MQIGVFVLALAAASLVAAAGEAVAAAAGEAPEEEVGAGEEDEDGEEDTEDSGPSVLRMESAIRRKQWELRWEKREEGRRRKG